MTTRVVIAGGGVAALECALALTAQAPERVSITLVAPEESFSYRPLSVGEPFALGASLTVPLASVAEDLHAEYRRDVVVSVAPQAHRVVLAGGDELPYDALVVATGARRVAAFRHATTFRGSEDAEAVHGVIQDVESGYVRHIAFIAPAELSWTLPLYELALIMQRRAYDMSVEPVELTVVTAEERPLTIFGSAASDAVARLLAERGIAVETSTHAEVAAHSRVLLRPQGRTLACDRIVALASVAPRPLAGLPRAPDGFMPVDVHGRVSGVVDVYAAGDGTTFPVKQGGIACEQADAVAESIGQQAGMPIEPKPFRPVLRGQLLTGGRRRFLRTDLSGRSGDVSDFSKDSLWWPPSKVAGIYLAPYLAARAAHRAAEATGVVRAPVVMVPRSGGPELEILDFARDSRAQ